MDGPGQIQPKRRLNKILLVGDPQVGKRTLAWTYLDRYNKKPEGNDLEKDIFNFYIDGTHLEMTVEAVKNPDEYRFRDPPWVWANQWAHYPNTSVILICVDVGAIKDKRNGNTIAVDSVRAVKERWAGELYYFFGAGNVEGWETENFRREARRVRAKCLRMLKGRRLPFLLVGCQTDWRASENGMTLEEGIDLANDIGADAYLECSACMGEGVYEVFQKAARLALEFADSETVEEKKESWWRNLGDLFKRLRWSR